ncbi:MAG: hypothetical protein ACRD47_06170 [Nitrososphaeraceae archaeon]
MSKEAERLQWRRNKVLELSSQGRSQPQIARILQIGLGTVNRDLQYLRQEAKDNITKYINERLPLEYQKCLVGLDGILAKTWDIANNEESSERDRLQAVSIGMQAYGMKIDLLTSASVVERAVKFVEKNRSDNPSADISQNINRSAHQLPLGVTIGSG